MSDRDLEHIVNPADLILRYLSGNATQEDVQQLEMWVMASSDNRAQFMAIKRTWMLASSQVQDSKIDVDDEWNAISDQLFSSGKVVTLSPDTKYGRRRWLGIAATTALLILASVFIFRSKVPGEVSVVAHNEVIDQALSDGSMVTLNRNTSVYF